VADDEDVFCSMPLAEYSFASMLWVHFYPEMRLRYFYQTLIGLGIINGRSKIRRYIRPKGLVLVPIGQSEGVIFQ